MRGTACLDRARGDARLVLRHQLGDGEGHLRRGKPLEGLAERGQATATDGREDVRPAQDIARVDGALGDAFLLHGASINGVVANKKVALSPLGRNEYEKRR